MIQAIQTASTKTTNQKDTKIVHDDCHFKGIMTGTCQGAIFSGGFVGTLSGNFGIFDGTFVGTYQSIDDTKSFTGIYDGTFIGKCITNTFKEKEELKKLWYQCIHYM
jgi:hypothetical protein